MTDDEIKEGIAAYMPMQNEIREFLAVGERSQHEFDDHFAAWNKPASVICYEPETFIMPRNAIGSFRYLFVMQQMIGLGEIVRRENEGVIFYQVNPES